MRGDEVLRIMTSYPYKDGVVDLEKYKGWMNRNEPDKMCTYDSGTYEIVDVNKEGFIQLRKDGVGEKKVLIRQKHLDAFKVGDTFHCKLKKKVFFVYWEITEFKNYVSQAIH